MGLVGATLDLARTDCFKFFLCFQGILLKMQPTHLPEHPGPHITHVEFS